MKAGDIVQPAKPCRKCGMIDRTPGGKCRTCNTARAKDWYYKNRDRAIANGKAYRDKNPEKHAALVAAYVANNMAKKKNNDAIWHAANKERLATIKAEWMKLNPGARRRWYENRRARILGYPGSLSKDIINKLLGLQRSRCACCGETLGEGYHLDHIMPLALGGANEDSNVQLLKAECNLRKHAKHPIDYMQSRGFLL